MCKLMRSMAALMAAIAVTAAAAGDQIHVRDAWSRAMPAVARNGAAYMKIANGGPEDDRLVAVDRVPLRLPALHRRADAQRRNDQHTHFAGGTAGRIAVLTA